MRKYLLLAALCLQLPLWAAYDVEINPFTKTISANQTIATITTGDGSKITLATGGNTAGGSESVDSKTCYYCTINNTSSNASSCYFEVASEKSAIQSVEFLLTSNNDDDFQPVVLFWKNEALSTSADSAIMRSKFTMDKGYNNAEWISYDCSKKKTSTVRIYRDIKGVEAPPYPSSSKGISLGKGLRVYGVRVKLFTFLEWSDGLQAGDTIQKASSSADFKYTATPTTASTGAISYSSDNKGIASVDASTGKVQMEGGFGIAKITATQAASGDFPAASICYYINVAETKIIEQSTGPIYYDDHNSKEFCFQDSSHCLHEYVQPIYVTATGVTGYQWQRSSDGSSWTNMQDTTSSSFLPYIPRAIDDSIITYYRCQVSGTSTLYTNPVKVIVEPAKGCFPNHRIDATVIAKKTLSVDGTILDHIKTECNLEGKTAVYEGKTGYKMGFNKAHVGITLTDGYTFQPGDIVRVFITEVGDYGSLGGYGDSTLHIFSSMDGDTTTHVGSIDGLRQGWNEWYLPKSVGNINTICLYRHGEGRDSLNTNQNHFIYEMQVVRLEDCYDCAEKDPTITIHASGNPPTLFADSIYQIEGSLEGALSGYWTEKSDASKFGDVRSPQTTIKFNDAGSYTITWTISDQHSHNRWGCRKYTEKTVEVFKAFPIELHSSCAHKISQRPDSVSPTNTVTFEVENCTDSIGKYLANDQLYVTAISDDSCVVFTKWSDDVTTNPRMFKVSETNSVKPIFERIKYTVEAVAEPENTGDVTIEKKEE